MSGIATVGADAFDGRRLARNGTWAVAFLADWCPFCRAFSPQFAALAGPGVQLLVADVTDLESPLWDRFDLEVIPAVIVFRDGEPSERVDAVPMRGLDETHVDSIRRALGARSPPAARPSPTRPREG